MFAYCSSMTPNEMLVASILAALGLALLIGWLAWGRPLRGLKVEAGTLRTHLDERTGELSARAAELAGLSAELSGARQQLSTLEPEARRALDLAAEVAAYKATADEREKAHARQLAELETRFSALAATALDAAQKRFADQAAETLKTHRLEAEKGVTAGKQALADLISPIRETMGRFETSLGALEQKREQAYGQISEQLSALSKSEAAVREEAGRIVAALRGSARASGAWGEAQLRNVLDMAGLREGIDFDLQPSQTDADGSRRRPDAIIRLPGGRELIIDSKCVLSDYVAASEATRDEDRKASLRRHAAAVRLHAKGLSEKAYWKEHAQSADFVVLFLPGENFLSAALEQDLDLLSWALDQRILLAGPTNLLAIARVVAMVWRQERMAEETRVIASLAKDLYERLSVMTGHANAVGRNLDEAAKAWNRFVGSLESRVLVTGRKLAELGVEAGEATLAEPRTVETTLRLIQAPEAEKNPRTAP